MTDQERLEYLFNAYVSGQCTPEERREFLSLAGHERYASKLKALIETVETCNEVRMPEDRANLVFDKVWNSVDKSKGITRRLPYRTKLAVAACVILLAGIGIYFMINPQSSVDPTATTTVNSDVPAPTTTKAMITLADGRRVSLDSLQSGMLAQQGGMQVIKNEDGEIVYTGAAGEVGYNTMFNPRGSEVVSLVLADGTKVWLNSESSLRYPVAFSGAERKVEVTGEAYFEVAHNAKMPFIVSKDEVAVTVLGTKFNVNAYEDESDIKVTLLEGSVKASLVNGDYKLLQPGEQAIVTNKVVLTKDPNIEQVMAWKNGLFSFDNADMATVLRQVARWYDVQVVYEGEIPKRKFKGKIPRDLSLAQLLNGLSTVRIKYKFEQGKVIILPEQE